MPGEEMEISTDFGQPNFGEDIDIDLDFATAQHDEDIELGDFDGIQDMHNFNTDTRDEMMGEGDDTSYGMIDADDLDRNEAATAGNDIEIDLGDIDVNIWEQDITIGGDDPTVTDTDFVHDMGEQTSQGTVDNTSQLQASVSQVTGQNEHTVLDSTLNTVEESSATGENPALQVTSAPEAIDYQDFGATPLEHNVDITARVSEGPEAWYQEGRADPGELDTATVAGHLDAAADEAPVTHHSGDVNGASTLSEDTSDKKSVPHSGPEDEDQDSGPSGYVERPVGGGDDGDVPAEHDAVPDPASDEEHSPVQELESSDANAHRSTSLLETGSYSELENSGETENGQIAPNDITAPQAPEGNTVLDKSNLEFGTTEGTSSGDALLQNTDDEDSPLVIATQQEIFISYGETDYRLFAKSEDDDPNQYFLSDMSSLESSLAGFLSSLRSVVSEEVSPLDELVMHVDGLGIEFAESSANDILEKHTFGDILSLYHQLVKNEGGETSPDLYMYLMVRPSCSQRLMALMDSASSGRGLSEVAVYREVTPQDEESASQADDISGAHETGDEDRYEFEEDRYADDEAFPTAAGAGDTIEHGALLPQGPEAFVTNDVQGQVQELQEADDISGGHNNVSDGVKYAEETVAEAVIDTDAHAEDPADPNNNAEELIDYSDYEEEAELSSSKQDSSGRESRRGTPVGADDVDSTNPGNAQTQVTPLGTMPASAEPPNSDNTSVTATANGDDEDEIDYSDGEDVEAGTEADGISGIHTQTQAPQSHEVTTGDEITWESDEEDVDESVVTSKQTVQVSPVHGKRTRSDSDGLEVAGDENDVKRRRS
ncbi:hypothetical protein F4778DRAFT_778858 [Xylariomycetidae sp. FL2044]|nr:hypothetical protein F4778DRAFT_778858 [Xylariomycetidae sp. FL2044]